MADRFPMFGPKKHRFFGGEGDAGVDEFAVELNLTPLMDVMSNILFFLLAGFGAAIISFLAASVPVQAENDSPPEPPRMDKVTVNIQITASAYKVNLSADKVPADELNKFKKELPKTEAGYDTKSLAELMFQIKQKFPASDTVMIVPNEHTLYSEIVGAMEVIRETVHDGKRLRLFPKAVVADLVRE